ncbi:MAG: PKD domain-containing protein [bacterium]
MTTTSKLRAALAAIIITVLAGLVSCQGNSAGGNGVRPRSRSDAGTYDERPHEEVLSHRDSVDSDGGEVEYRTAKVTVPRGAVSEPIFLEISIPAEPQDDVFPESAFQLSPDGVQLKKDALLSISYYNDDIPQGKDEKDIVIVHKINGVWVELSNSEVFIHENLVQAPISYLGLYALRITHEDPRVVNQPPVASFEFSRDPFPEQLGLDPDEASRQQAEQAVSGEVQPSEGEAAESAEDAGEDKGPKPPGDPNFDPDAAGRPPGARPISMIPQRLSVGAQVSPEDRQRMQESASANVVEEDVPEATAAADDVAMTAESPFVTVYFDASKSYDPDGHVVQYDWDFDSDGIFDYSSHSSPYAEHTFKHNGDYSVALKVTDNGRYSQVGFGTGLVRARSSSAEPKALSANISAYPPFGDCPLTVHFASTVTGGTAPYSYEWTFSDGSESNLPNPYTTYADVDAHIVSYRVTDILGEELTGRLSVNAWSGHDPSAPLERMRMDIEPSVRRGQAPFMATFNLNVDRATEPVTYRITFGDEAPDEPETVSRGRLVNHEYTNAGFYIVKIIATDADLRTATTFATVNAWPSESPRDFTLSTGNVGADPFAFGHEMTLEFDYTNASKRSLQFYPENTPLPVGELTYHWDFGDGTYSTDKKPEHTFAKDGIYEVRMRASDGLQAWQQRIWLPISAEDPAAAIQRPSYIEGPAPFELDLDAIVTRGEEPLRYDWYIGDDRRSDPSTWFAFQQPGEYEIRLDITDKFDQLIHAPPVKIRVRPGPLEYRQPVAVIEPLTGSTRAVVMDYTAANALPLSSPTNEGGIGRVDLSADGAYIAIVSDFGLLVKEVASGDPVASFLPDNGEIVALQAVEGGRAYVSIETAGGIETWLVRPPCDPLFICDGFLFDASGIGTVLAVGDKLEKNFRELRVVSVDPDAGQVGEPLLIGKAAEARLSRDGRYLFHIDDKSRIVRRHVPSGDVEFLATGGDRKQGLAVSGDGESIVFASHSGERSDIILGRYDMSGVFQLASVTDRTGFYSEHMLLNGDGGYLLAYGSRDELLALVRGEDGEATVAEDEIDAEGDDDDAPQYSSGPPSRRERFGVIRLDLSGSPDGWSISTVNPRFVTEGGAQFSIAGPF